MFVNTDNQIPNLTMQSLVKVNSQGTGTTAVFGLAGEYDGTPKSSSFEKIAFIFDESTNEIYGYTSNGTTQHVTSGTAYTTATWYELKMVTDNAGANVEFFVNGSSIGSIAIPALSPSEWNCSPFYQVAGTTGAAINVDYFLLNQSLTR